MEKNIVFSFNSEIINQEFLIKTCRCKNCIFYNVVKIHFIINHEILNVISVCVYNFENNTFSIEYHYIDKTIRYYYNSLYEALWLHNELNVSDEYFKNKLFKKTNELKNFLNKASKVEEIEIKNIKNDYITSYDGSNIYYWFNTNMFTNDFYIPKYKNKFIKEKEITDEYILYNIIKSYNGNGNYFITFCKQDLINQTYSIEIHNINEIKILYFDSFKEMIFVFRIIWGKNEKFKNKNYELFNNDNIKLISYDKQPNKFKNNSLYFKYAFEDVILK